MKSIHLTYLVMCGMAMFQNPLSAQPLETSAPVNTNNPVPDSSLEVQTYQTGTQSNVYYVPEPDQNVQVYDNPNWQGVERKEGIGVYGREGVQRVGIQREGMQREGIQYGREGVSGWQGGQQLESRDMMNTHREGEFQHRDNGMMQHHSVDHDQEAGHHMDEHHLK